MSVKRGTFLPFLLNDKTPDQPPTLRNGERNPYGIGDFANTAKGFIEAWKRAEQGEKVKTEKQLNVLLT